ncbi:MAG: hypothetical protein IJF69_01780 [Clostridia bacterium]|nr:hypothetical protein [Clostridia bacterium]
MFAVKPLQDKSVQKELCNMLNTEYIPDSLAYFAADLNEDGSAIIGIIGVLQFKMFDEAAEILTLVPAHGKEDDEAMIIMERAAMSFMWRSGMKKMIMKETAGPDSVLSRSGLPKKNGEYYVDLDVFFDSPCHFNKNNA